MQWKAICGFRVENAGNLKLQHPASSAYEENDSTPTERHVVAVLIKTGSALESEPMHSEDKAGTDLEQNTDFMGRLTDLHRLRTPQA
jgi:hypothetical protein